MTDTPRIYVACLAAYNNGRLHGTWIDIEGDANTVYEEIQAMLADSPIPGAEEWAIHDYEGFHSIRLSEYSGIDEVCDLVALVREHGALGAAIYGYYGDLDEAKTALEERYCGKYDSLADYAQQ
jgi:antirestriction protein